VNLLLYCVSELFLVEKIGDSWLYRIIYVLLNIFSLVWMILGVVWYYQDPECANRKNYSGFTGGYSLVNVIIITFFVLLGLFGCLCLATIVGAIYLAVKNR